MVYVIKSEHNELAAVRRNEQTCPRCIATSASSYRTPLVIREHVIVLNVDIRDFSTFSERVESVQAALYIKKVYQKLLAEYFPDATFFKPTGDGLLLIYSFDDESLKSVSRSVVKTSLRLIAHSTGF